MARVTEKPIVLDSRIALAGRGQQTAIIVAVVVGVLYFGRQIFVPLALAVLLSFMLAPLVFWLERVRIPRVVAVVGSVILAFVVILSFGFEVTGRLTDFVRNVPQYETNLEAKIKLIRDNGGPAAFLGPASGLLQQLGRDIAQPAELEGQLGRRRGRRQSL